MALKLRNIKNGEKFYGECVAMDDELKVLTDGNIQMWGYSFPDYFLVFWVWAETPGSHGLRPMIKEVQKVKKLKVVQPMLAKLYDLFYEMGVEMVSVDPEIAPRIPLKPDEACIKPLRNNHYLPDDFAPFVREYMKQMMFGPDVDPGHEPDGRYEMRYSDEMVALIKRLYAKYPSIFKNNKFMNGSRINPIFPISQ